MAWCRKGLLPIKIGHTRLRVMLRKQNKFSGFFAKSLRFSFEVWVCFFPFQIIIMSGREGYFATSHRSVFNGVFMDFCMEKNSSAV